MSYRKIRKFISSTILFIFIATNSIYAAPNSTLRPTLSSDADLIEGFNDLEKNPSDIDEGVKPLMAYLARRELPKLEKKHIGEDLTMIEEALKKFLKQEVEPNVRKWEEQGSNITNILDKLMTTGLNIFSISIPEEYSGLGLSHYYTYRIVEMLSYYWPSLAVTVAVTYSFLGAVNKFGSEEQKKKIFSKAAKERFIGAIAITEPDSGSDAMKAMKTYAEEDGNEYVLNGTKTMISSIKIADMYIVFAVTDREKGEISTFLVEEGSKGLTIGMPEKKMGQKASFTGELIFEDCRIPKENMLGKPGQGTDVFNEAIGISGRISIASLALGIAKVAYDKASRYTTKERRQFGRLISELEEPKDRLDDMKSYIAISEMLIGYASYLKDKDLNKEEPDKEEDKNALSAAASMAKLFSTEKGQEVTIKAMELFGGYGYMEKYDVERFLRDIKVTVTYEGTSQIQKLIIKKHMPLFLNSEVDIEKAIDSYLDDARLAIPDYRQVIQEIHGAIGDAEEVLRKVISEKKGAYRHAEIFVHSFITKLMLLRAIFLANQDNALGETVTKSLENALLASRFLRDELAKYDNAISTEILLNRLNRGLSKEI